MDKIGLGLVGCGRFGRRLAQVASQIPIFQLIGACDVEVSMGDQLGRELRIPTYATHDELLNAPDLDAIMIATSHDAHCPVAVAAAEAGYHVFCEKPMALNVAECRTMIRNAQTNGTKLLIGHVMRQLPLVREVRRLVLSGGLGQPVAMIGMRHQVLQRSGWWTLRARSGGLLHSPGIHNLDLMNWFLGRAVNVYAVAAPQLQKDLDYPDTIFMQVQYESGAIGSLTASISDPSNAPAGANCGHIICKRGAITFDLVGDGRVACYSDDEPSTHIILADQLSISHADGASYALNAELINFAEWILGTAEPFIKPNEAADAVELCEAAYLSIEQGIAVALPLGGLD